MQSYFPDGPVTATPYAGQAQIPLEPEPIYSRKKGKEHEVIGIYDAEFRARFDRKITGWAIDFMTRANEDGKPFYMYLPYTQVHIPPIPDPEFAHTTRRGNWADLLTQLDAFTGQILDALDELGLAEDTIVVWSSDNGGDPNFRMPAADPDPLGGQWEGFSGPWRGGYFTSLEGSNRAPCIIRWPGRIPAGKVSNELVRLVDWFTTLLLAAGAEVPDDRMIDGMDMRGFLLGDAEESGRDTVLCIQGDRLQAIKWRQWKAPSVPAGRVPLDLDALQHAAPAQPGVGSPRGTPGRLPARLGGAPDGRRRGCIPELAHDRAADQTRDTRSVHPARTR
jgi:arylsulfatase